MTDILVQRQPLTRKASDLTNVRAGRLVAKELVGFIGNMSAWRCDCDCGGSRIVRGPFFAQAAKGKPGYTRTYTHCGCQKKNTGLSKRDGYSFWVRKKQELCGAWQSFQSFDSECLSSRAGRFLVAVDPAKPIGPGNFRWQKENPLKGTGENAALAAEAVMQLRGWTREQAEQWVASVSRQRASQIIFHHRGLCMSCGKPRGRWRKYCDRCTRENRLRRNPMAKVVDDFPHSANYDWDNWLDGQTWELEPGKDICSKVSSFRAHLNRVSFERGVTTITRFRNGKL